MLTTVLNFYGAVKYVNDQYDSSCDVKTGVRVAEIEFKKAIPSYIFVGKIQVRVDYEGQTKTCQKCQQSGHIARDCTAGRVCRECGSPGHGKAECPKQRCYHCGAEGHREAECPTYYDFPALDETEQHVDLTSDTETITDAAQMEQDKENGTKRTKNDEEERPDCRK